MTGSDAATGSAATDRPVSIDELVTTCSDPLVARDVGDVRVLVFNRAAARNAMTVAMRRRFAELVADGCAQESVRTMIVTGAGGVFSAGLDIKEQGRRAGQPMIRPHPAEVVRSSRKPIIAAVDGACVTGALELALGCSFIIASDRARFADTHARIGVLPGWGLSAMLPRAIGVRRARQMMLTGAFVPAHQALDWGLVNEVVASEALLGRCLELAADIAGCDSAASLAGLELVNGGEDLAMADALQAEYAASTRRQAPGPVAGAEERRSG
jgi:enoyl-CoA hydratase